MPFFTDNIRAGASGGEDEYTIERSLRCDGHNGYLTRTPSSTGNRKIWTWSGWVKRTKLFNNDYIFSCNSQSGNDGIAAIYWKSGNNRLQFYFDTDGSNPYGDINTREYRDVANWYHIVWQVDASNTSQRIWVNGVEENITGGNPPNYDYAMNRSGYAHAMGTQGWDGHTNRAHMYFAEIHYSDGYKYEASDFGETNSETGVWSPKKVNINYGTNGFYLKFEDNSNNTATTIGKDSSGNGNNWTPNGISVTSTTDNDSLIDTPTNNFCTFHKLNSIKYNANYDTIISMGGLLMRGGDNVAPATMTYPKSGKWYCEFTKYNNGFSQGVSVVRADTDIRNLDGVTSHSSKVTLTTYPELLVRGSVVSNNGNSWENDGGAVIGVAVDMDNGAVYFAINNTWINSGDPTSGASKTGAAATDLLTVNDGYHYVAAQGFNGSNSAGMYGNFGQRSFAYTPPSGYKTLCTKNLPTPAIKNPALHFNTLLYTGNDSNDRDITGVGFQPDFLWIKNREGPDLHMLQNAIRGANKNIYTNNTDNEQTNNTNGHVNSFLADGFNVTAGDSGNVNENNENYVAWNWNAGGSTVTNNDGSTSAQVRANATAGFSIVTYTGTGSTTTIGHGLGVAPEIIMIKTLSSGDHWGCYHHKVGNGKIVYLNIINAPASSSGYWGNTTPSSTVFTVGNDNKTNKSGDVYVAYCFTGVSQYSKFGKYTGNGSSDGTFIYLGFKPAFFMFRQVTYSDNWYMYDNKRDPINPTDNELNPSNGQSEASSHDIDFTSNGVKLRTSNSSWNYSNYEYIYMAFAESPFKYARAR